MTAQLTPSQHPATARLSLELLGPARITLDGAPLAFAYEKVLALLAYLAVEADRPHRRTALAELLWPEQDGAAARHNLSQALFHLRRMLPDELVADLLETTRDTVRLHTTGVLWVDVGAFRRLTGAGAGGGVAADDARSPITESETAPRQAVFSIHRPGMPADAEVASRTAVVDRLAHAVALYRSEFLEGLGVGDSPDFDEWVLLTRESLRAQACAALRRLSAPEGGVPEIVRRGAYARRWATLDPLDEAAHRQLMLALAAHGQRAAALLQYEQCRRLLASELGLEPEPATTALYEELRRQASQTPVAGLPPNLPARHRAISTPPLQSTRLVGRVRDLATLAVLLADPLRRLVTITGPGGVGKTRLALQAAAEGASLFADGVCWVRLAGVREPALVPAALARALDLPQPDPRPLAVQLADALADRQLLLVLDNCEHLLPELAGQMAGLLDAAPQLVILATSRAALQISHERRYPLAPLALPAADLPPEAQRNTAAVALFIERAQAIRPGIALDPVVIGAICRRLDGLPLAIELAATRTRLISPPDLLARLERRLPLLSGGPRDLPERQQNLAATIDWSYRLLSPAQQALFRRLAVFVGGWTTAAAEAVSKQTEEGKRQHSAHAPVAHKSPNPPDVLDGLAALLDASLIVEMANPTGEPRCTMLETIREFAHEQLADCGELALAQALHAQALADLASRAGGELTGQDQRMWLQRIDQEQGNFQAALEWCLHHAVGLGMRLAGDLGRYWVLRGQRREGHHWLERLLAAADCPDQPAPTVTERAYALLISGVLAMILSDQSNAEERLRASLALYRTLDDPRNLARALNGIGCVTLRPCQLSEAEGYLQEGLAVSRAVGDVEGAAVALRYLGEAARMRDDLPLAQHLMEQSLAAYREAGDRAYEAVLLARIGDLLLCQDDVEGARQIFTASGAVAGEVGIRPVFWLVQRGLGDIAYRQGHHADAQQHYRQALIVANEVKLYGALPSLLLRLAFSAWADAPSEWAVVLLSAAHTLLEGALDDPVLEAETERCLAAMRAILDPPTFAQAWAYGAALSLERAMAYAAAE